MNIVFRVDASSEIGTGHVIRCLSLANKLRVDGKQCAFICRNHKGNLIEQIRKQAFEVFVLPQKQECNVAGHLQHAPWLGCEQATDAAESRLILQELHPEWLVVDHYGIDVEWEESLRDTYKNLLVIDDLADRKHCCDVLVDQNLVVGMDHRYDGKVPKECAILLGPTFAILQREYSKFHANLRVKSNQIEKILIYFGGADSTNLTTQSLNAVLQLENKNVVVDVVLAKDAPFSDEVDTLVNKHDNVTRHYLVPSLVELFNKTDLAIGGGGTTNWERICMGVPSVVITMAKNQESIAKRLHEEELITWIGNVADINQQSIFKTLHKLFLGDGNAAQSKKCLGIVDGLGANRVCIRLTQKLSARLAENKDKLRLLEWANDPVTRNNSFTKNKITQEEHCRWFSSCLSNNSCHLFIVEDETENSIGTVRFDNFENSWEIHFSLAPSCRGKGLGRFLVSSGITAIQHKLGRVTITGKVKQSNATSIQIFKSLGFSLQNRNENNTVLLFLGKFV